MDSTSAATKPIVVGVDDSPSSIAALRKAAQLGAALGMPVHAVTVWHSPVTFDGSARNDTILTRT